MFKLQCLPCLPHLEHLHPPLQPLPEILFPLPRAVEVACSREPPMAPTFPASCGFIFLLLTRLCWAMLALGCQLFAAEP